ncbi:MAG: DegT/DnrJ/EryC1/StrS family aminotransferase [Planctomycetia bacterium]|nr:DegT/DnrJ/EryC1/StrS family aminotransferase [Planctomycetia bacterium]
MFDSPAHPPVAQSVVTADPGASYRAHREEIDAAVRCVLERGNYILGQEVSAFESEFAAFLQVGEAVGVGSGTDALHLALRAVGVGPGDAVLTVAHTAVATVAAIDQAGAVPVLVEVDPATFTIDPGALEHAIRRHQASLRFKAVVPVHLYGRPAHMPEVVRIAERHGLFVIEDCAQAHGATIAGRAVGGWGHLSAFSFYPTKNLGACGDGGAVAGNHPRLLERVRSLRQYGWRQRFQSERPGFNSRLDELQAAILRVKLKHLDRENERRRSLAGRYDQLLKGTAWHTPIIAPPMQSVYHQYVIRGQERDGLRRFLSERGVDSGVHYPVPIHLQPGYRQKVIVAGSLQRTEALCREILSLPMHPYLTDDQIAHVARAIVEFDCQRNQQQGAA